MTGHHVRSGLGALLLAGALVSGPTYAQAPRYPEGPTVVPWQGDPNPTVPAAIALTIKRVCLPIVHQGRQPEEIGADLVKKVDGRWWIALEGGVTAVVEIADGMRVCSIVTNRADLSQARTMALGALSEEKIALQPGRSGVAKAGKRSEVFCGTGKAGHLSFFMGTSEPGQRRSFSAITASTKKPMPHCLNVARS